MIWVQAEIVIEDEVGNSELINLLSELEMEKKVVEASRMLAETKLARKEKHRSLKRRCIRAAK